MVHSLPSFRELKLGDNNNCNCCSMTYGWKGHQSYCESNSCGFGKSGNCCRGHPLTSCDSGCATTGPKCVKPTSCPAIPPFALHDYSSGDNSPCTDGEILGDHSGCYVQCAPGYSKSSGLGYYYCDNNGVLSPASLTCTKNTPEPSCLIGQLPDHASKCMQGNSPYQPGNSLPYGQSCTITCDTG